MIPELGHIALCLATVFALLHLLAPALTRSALTAWLPQQASAISTVIFFLISTALAAHIHAYAVSDFTVLNVILNSHSLKPMLYKITGSWGNHEGSMLLWLWVLTQTFYRCPLTALPSSGLAAAAQNL